ncbi:hypothetical protein J31TS4_31850 [Paenibacillus sp. J31TS4]|uniref:hypothetical protein n=1 Tax=Paenibacillus sp. J31TS4 TaxID=2807195 RepID=UPI001B15A3FA|nr:hypothetical protein [Paenibacillus sp. J31TS4]GIP39905.1 hypothetical protein J31TS4_31850 [Paenibacillus sp. J31TS4]
MSRYIENDSEFVLAIVLKHPVSIWNNEHLIDTGGHVEWVTPKTVRINSQAYPREFYQFRVEQQQVAKGITS